MARKRRYSEEELKAIAAKLSQTVFEYEATAPRAATPAERNVLYKIMYGTLLGCQWGEVTRNDANRLQAIVDTAEFICNNFFPDLNGYKTLYLPIKDFLHNREEENEDDYMEL